MNSIGIMRVTKTMFITVACGGLLFACGPDESSYVDEDAGQPINHPTSTSLQEEGELSESGWKERADEAGQAVDEAMAALHQKLQEVGQTLEEKERDAREVSQDQLDELRQRFEEVDQFREEAQRRTADTLNELRERMEDLQDRIDQFLEDVQDEGDGSATPEENAQ